MRQTWAAMVLSVIAISAAACSGDSSEVTSTPEAPQPSAEASAAAVAPVGPFGDQISGAGPWDWMVTSLGEGTKPGIALDEEGAPLIAYLLERIGNDGFVNVASLADGRVSIETLQRGYFYGPLDIAARAGQVAVAYHNHDWEDGAIAIRGPSGWDVQRVEHPGHDGWDGSLAIDAEGALHVLSIDPVQFGATEGVEYAVNTDATWSVESIGSGPQPYEWGTDLAVDAAGAVHAVYFDAESQDLTYGVRSSAGWALTAISEDGDAGRFAAIALDSGGVPHMAFIRSDTAIADDGRHAVQVVYGTVVDDAWSFESVATLDALVTGFEGARRTVAIEVGPDGPVIAAIDESQLLVSRLVDGAWVTETVVEALRPPLQVVGLALDSEGAPHLTFATTTGNAPLDGEVWYLAPVAN